MTPTEVITALEKALEGCEQTQGADKPYELYMSFREQLAKACHPDAIRTLLDAHARALEDAERLRSALQGLLDDDGADFIRSRLWDAARAALTPEGR